MVPQVSPVRVGTIIERERKRDNFSVFDNVVLLIVLRNDRSIIFTVFRYIHSCDLYFYFYFMIIYYNTIYNIIYEMI